MTEDVIVRMKHLRAEKICCGGARRWWKAKGLDWSDFLENGIASSILGQWDDPAATRVIATAKREAEHVG